MATVEMTPDRTPSPAPESPPLVALLRESWADPASRPPVIGGAAALGLLGVLFWQNIRHFVLVWSTDENYSHGFLVPLISLYFANEAARRGPVAVRSGLGIGSAMIAFALTIKLATIVIPFPVASDYGLLIALAGSCAVLVGIEALRRYWFAFFFLVFMVPLPVALYSLIANPLQLMVSQVATSMLNVLGIPSLCDGNMITLPGGNQLFVAEACSGMRQLTGFLALTTAWTYLSDRPAWNRVLLIGSSIPIAMTANVVRVTLTGGVTYHLDPKYASGAFHTVEGLAMMGLGLLMLSTFSWSIDQARSFLAPSVPEVGPPGSSSMVP
jgi:exosortase